MDRLQSLRVPLLSGLLLVYFWATAQAQTFTNLASFDGTNGSTPDGALVQGLDGNFYGTTSGAEANSGGTVFKITPSGVLTSIYSFSGTGGTGPRAGLTLGENGNFYGTTFKGGTYNYGTIFEITPAGSLTTLYNFTGTTDGGFPTGLVLGLEGDFYGESGETETAEYGCLFRITPSGTFTLLASFDGTNGGYPYGGLATAGGGGGFYGTTIYGGSEELGSVFKFVLDHSSGTITSLATFDGTDGSYPYGGVVRTASGALYGTTTQGGTSNYGTAFEVDTSGTLISFLDFSSGGSLGGGPNALIQATDGNFYGTAYFGGEGALGTIYQLTPDGVANAEFSFDGTNGNGPLAGLVQGTNGVFYGTTGFGGGGVAPGNGTVFSLSMGLGPFVSLLPTFGRLRTDIAILGTDLTGATSVTFNGTAATFTVVSPSEITATIPPGATTGPVEVVTPGGTLTSNTNFTVSVI